MPRRTRRPLAARRLAAGLALALTVACAARDDAARAVAPPAALPPRLLVLVAVDQCRADYLARFGPALAPDGGFRRLLEGGASFPDAAHTHTVTSTGPGHAALATGCLPAHAGIPENEWIDVSTGRRVYCVADPAGGISPASLERPTLGDAMKARHGPDARVVSVGFKDRVALLLGGRRADAVAWFELGSGRWTGRTGEARVTPSWAVDANGGPDGPGPLLPWAGTSWTAAVPEALAARLCGPDDAPGEDRNGDFGRSFPHAHPAADAPLAARVAHAEVSPVSDEITLQLALAALAVEPLGRDEVPDLLCIGFAGLDNVGHDFGPDSREVLEAFVALDGMLGRLMDALDERVGAGRWTLALSSDHGVAPVPEPTGGLRLVRGALEAELEAGLSETFGAPPPGADGAPARWLLGIAKPSVYLDRRTLSRADVPFDRAAQELARRLRARPGLAGAWTRAELAAADPATEPDAAALARDVHAVRSGDVLFLFARGTVFTGAVATDHGSHHDYDRRVPILLYGAGIVPGARPGAAAPIDLAPTLARLAGLGELTGADGRVLAAALAPGAGTGSGAGR